VNDEGLERAEAGLVLDVILRDESEMNRTIYYMYHVDNMTLAEIGEASGLSVSGVRKKLEAFRERARRKFR